PPGGVTDPVLAACALAGVTRIFRVGGAQAIAALAYGTATIPRVDKVVGPGNRWVAEAKRQVMGQVGIDMVAGPTEVLILADSTARPERVAADLIAQAEHDEDASAWCVTSDEALADALPGALAATLARAPRAAIARVALERNGLLVVVPSLEEGIEVANLRAPEHLEIVAEGADRIAADGRHAGAIFLGGDTPEPVGGHPGGPRPVPPRAGGRPPGRPQPRAADGRHGPVRVALGSLRLRQAHQPDPVQRPPPRRGRRGHRGAGGSRGVVRPRGGGEGPAPLTSPHGEQRLPPPPTRRRPRLPAVRRRPR